MDLKDIEKNYERKSDEEIIRIATTDAYGLRPEVYAIIENELKKRNLDHKIIGGVIAQNKEYTKDELEVYSNNLRNLPCPICGDEYSKLNATISHTVASFIVFSTYSAKLTIACPNCLNQRNNNAMLSTAFLGWWAPSAAIFKTPLYIYRNYKAKKQNNISNANDTLLSFTLAKIGEIEVYKNDREKLKEIIKLVDI